MDADIQAKFDSLKPEWQVFIKEYLIDFNSSRAYSVAYNRSIDDTCRSNAPKLLVNTCIIEIIQAELKDKFNNNDLTANEILHKLTLIMRADLSKIVSFDGSNLIVKDFNTLPEELKYAMQEVSQTKDGITIKLVSKLDAMDKLGKYFKLFVESNKIELDLKNLKIIRPDIDFKNDEG